MAPAPDDGAEGTCRRDGLPMSARCAAQGWPHQDWRPAVPVGGM